MKRLTFILSALLVCVFVPLSAEIATVYISPNNDGVQDTLNVPVKIRDKRYISEWSFVITDESGHIVRTIGNKVALPTKPTFKDFLSELFAPKHGVDIPDTVSWNGILDDGTVAPDGVYYYYVTAGDDNGNTASTSKHPVVVDNTPPEISLTAVPDNLKTFGAGSRPTLDIHQTGSEERLWTARIRDKAGNDVVTYEWEDSAPADLSWDGSTGPGQIAPDGVYSYEISCTDLAGNKSEAASISNIIFSSEKPEVAIFIQGSRYFAPAPKGDVWQSKPTMDFAVAIPSPVSSVNALTDWSISIVGRDSDEALYTRSGRSNPPSTFSFDGKDTNSYPLPEGEYRARVTARYLNGYEPAPSYSPVFVLDNEAPQAQVSLPKSTVFNGVDDFVIDQRFLPEPSYTGAKTWTGSVVNADGQTVRTYNFGETLPEKVSWDGLNDGGQLAPDGSYRYGLYVTELAGNAAEVQTGEFVLDTSATELALSVSTKAFSPNADSVLDTVDLIPIAHASSGINTYELTVSGADGVVKTFSGEGAVPSSFTWDGTNDRGAKCPDGTYSASIRTVAGSGTETVATASPFSIDTVPPTVSVSAPYTLFSPDGISSRQSLPITVSNCSPETYWSAQVRNDESAIIKTYSWTDGTAQNFAWDGTDDNGNKAPNGSYSLLVYSTDAAGNSGSALLDNITLDARPVGAYVTAAYTGISPNGDGVLDSQVFAIKVMPEDGITDWKLDIIGGYDDVSTVKTFTGGPEAPTVVSWAGDGPDGRPAEGLFYAKLNVNYEKGNSVDEVSTGFICTATPPDLSVKTSPTYFSPDNDGTDDDLFINLECNTIANLKDWDFTIKDRNGEPFWQTSGKTSVAEQIVWDGRGNNGNLVQSAEDYTYEFTARDDLGMQNAVTGTISVDVLVIRDGDKLKMQIPSIVFRSNEADFGVQQTDANGRVIRAGITQAQADNNDRVLARIASILKKFKDYNILISGHANRISDNDLEETQAGSWGPALIPLSEQRAQFVKTKLVELGINASRLSVEGKGGTEPVADRKDSSVNWQNRRVEFILEK